ncbi:uncharacterized protein LOC110033242 [Phalaenopsis equestris]|uniref:uncharacterized protein LOC110033242 n=1 Tax=Phalaenopsis equestris TaxID=78828 RepID=UPI0009E59BC4|nr:uncharacterized protein LOC110033242 [Phalaenopsis equestris]
MKASLKFREDQRPLARAKIPISILSIPFLAGAAAGDKRDLRLDLTTAFESGPAFRVSYRPNEPFNTFTLSVKTGIGAFGSPVGAPFSMITEFNLSSPRGVSGSPIFSVVFKPRLGDFCFRKSASSSSPRGIIPVSDGEEMFPPSPSPAPGSNGIHHGGKANGIMVNLPAARGEIGGLISGIDVTARSVLPIRSRAMIGFRWGFRMPRELQSSFSMDTFSMTNLPMLVMNKIFIKHIPADAKSKLLQNSEPNVAAGQVTQACKSVMQDIAALQNESATLRKTVEGLREKIDSSCFPSEKVFAAIGNKDSFGAEAGKGGLRAAVPPPEPSKRERRSEVKSVSEDVNEELKKALMSATSAGK